jgi:sirohydrochlorin cobaltochelatase
MIGLVLFAHGARDARWREPFDRLKAAVAQGHGGPVELAFLEAMEPDLIAAAQRLKMAGAQRIVVVPLFLGSGGHLREDLPALLVATERSCGLSVAAVGAVSESDRVLQAMADYCISSAR